MARSALTPAQRKRATIAPPPTSDDDPTFSAPVAANVNGISGARLRSFIERIERVQSEIDSLRADIKEIKAEAKGTGFDIKIVNYLLRIRKMDKDDLDEFETLADIYKRAIGMATE